MSDKDKKVQDEELDKVSGGARGEQPAVIIESTGAGTHKVPTPPPISPGPHPVPD